MRTIETTATVSPEGMLVVQVPSDIPPGDHRVVLVIEEQPTDQFLDVVQAASTSLDFWDNPYDDEDWNRHPIHSRWTTASPLPRQI
jgi:hypothetical protein